MSPLRLAVIGDPISHSRSPAIHNAALHALGIEGTYVARHVTTDDVNEVFAEIRRGDLDGINVTMPHKIAAAALCDELSDDARASDSVNTVVRRPDGTLVGHSTDVSGLRSIWKRKLPHDRAVLVLGTGGAAAAACLAASGRTVYVSARRAEAVTALSHKLPIDIIPIPWETAVVEAVVINATPLGMHGEALAEPILRLASAVVDMAYGDEPTPAVSRARELGLPLADGIDVLVAQAADAFRLWTSMEPPVDVMTAAARKPLSEDSRTPN